MEMSFVIKQFGQIFVHKNWPNDFKVGCKYFCKLVEFIAIYAYLEKELENLKNIFHWKG
jgi:hypothetical protein